MDRFEAPRADIAILGFLVCVAAIAGSVGGTMDWLMQPTVIANVAFTEPKRTPSFLHDVVESPVPDMERAAFDIAKEENAELGFATPTALAALAEAPPESRPEVKQAQKQARPKRVAQAPKPAPAEQRHAWGFAPHGFFRFR